MLGFLPLTNKIIQCNISFQITKYHIFMVCIYLVCSGTAVHEYIKLTRLSCYHHLKKSDVKSVLLGRQQSRCPHSLPPTIPITRINTTQSTLGDVPLHMAIPGQPLTTFQLLPRLWQISDLVDPS